MVLAILFVIDRSNIRTKFDSCPIDLRVCELQYLDRVAGSKSAHQIVVLLMFVTYVLVCHFINYDIMKAELLKDIEVYYSSLIFISRQATIVSFSPS